MALLASSIQYSVQLFAPPKNDKSKIPWQSPWKLAQESCKKNKTAKRKKEKNYCVLSTYSLINFARSKSRSSPSVPRRTMTVSKEGIIASVCPRKPKLKKASSGV